MRKLKAFIYIFIILLIFSGCSFNKEKVSGNATGTTGTTQSTHTDAPAAAKNNGTPVHQGKKIPKSVSETQSKVKLNAISKTEAPNDTSYTYTASSYEEYYSAIFDSLKKFSSSSDIKIIGYNDQNYSLNVVNNVLDDHYDVDYGLDSVSAALYTTSSGYDILHIEYVYKLSRSKMEAMKAEADAKEKEVVDSIIEDGMTDSQKELAIHDYIINNTRYDFTNYVNGTLKDEEFTDYGALIDHSAVCSGYAKAFYKMCTLAGLECYIVRGYGDNVLHTWNIVKIDGRYCHVDTTWDDPVGATDTLTYDYFNLTDEQISKDHTWNREVYAACN